MNWKQIFHIKGTDPWLMIAALGWNLLWTFFTLTIAYLVLTRGSNMETAVQIGLLASAFLGPFLGGWFIGRVAADYRGVTYGVIGSLASAIFILLMAIPGGIVGLMTAIVSLAGGLNGGLMSQRQRPY